MGRPKYPCLVCITTSDFDVEKYPIPPKPIERVAGVCNHTPCPEGYLQWHEWARLASKTHRQVTCPGCGSITVWLPKAIARAINLQEAREARVFAKAYCKDFDKRMKESKKSQPRKGTNART